MGDLTEPDSQQPDHEPAMEALPEEVQRSPYLSWILIGIGFALASSSLWVFAELADDFLEPEVVAFDKTVINWIHSFEGSTIHRFMFGITETGSVKAITLFSLITIYWLWKYKKDNLSILFFIITVAGGGTLNYMLKLFFQRPRPSINVAVDAVGFSFPSGHSMGSMVFYGFIGYLVIKSNRSRKTKVLLGALLGIFILLIGISRIYLNAHYPSDVIAGFSAGLVWLVLTITSLRAIKWQSKRKNLRKNRIKVESK